MGFCHILVSNATVFAAEVIVIKIIYGVRLETLMFCLAFTFPLEDEI